MLSRRQSTLMVVGLMFMAVSPRSWAIFPLLARFAIRALPRMIRGNRLASRSVRSRVTSVADGRTATSTVSKRKAERTRAADIPALTRRELARNRDVDRRDQASVAANIVRVTRQVNSARNVQHMLDRWESTTDSTLENRAHVARCRVCRETQSELVHGTTLGEYPVYKLAVRSPPERRCEEVLTEGRIGGKIELIWRCACRGADATWRFVGCRSVGL